MENTPASNLPSAKDVLREQFPGHAAVLDRIEKLRIKKQEDSLAGASGWLISMEKPFTQKTLSAFAAAASTINNISYAQHPEDQILNIVREKSKKHRRKEH